MFPYLASLKDDREFEQLCFDTLQLSGFSNVTWRGPGADGGRDIEAESHYLDPSGHFVRERWYVECKFYKESVPYSEVEPKLLAASKDSIDAVLLITSSHVKNTCLDSVREWLKLRPPLRFRYWTGHDLFLRVARSFELLQRYFPGFEPTSADRAQQLASKYELLLTGVQERLERQFLTLAQSSLGAWQGHHEVPPTGAESLEVLVSLLSSSRILGVRDQSKPSFRLVDVSEVLHGVLNRLFASRRSPLKFGGCQDPIFCNTSHSLLMSGLYEVLDNASRYAVNNSSVQLKCSGSSWQISVENDLASDLSEVRPFPRLGFRAAQAKMSHPGGAGMGCWIAQQLFDEAGVRVEWTFREGRCMVVVGGTIVPAS